MKILYTYQPPRTVKEQRQGELIANQKGLIRGLAISLLVLMATITIILFTLGGSA